MSSRRAHYKPGVISASELLGVAGYNVYPPDPSGYYLKRGNFVNDCCDLIAQGYRLDDHTWEVARRERERPLAKNGENRVETWAGYVDAYCNWLKKYSNVTLGIVLVECQGYLCSEAEALQGTFDQLVRIAGRGLVRLDIKAVSAGAVEPCTELQIALYDIIDALRAGWFLGLALHPDGTYHESWWRPYVAVHDARLAIRSYNRVFGPMSRYR
jgi:hypothetical protein